MFDESSPLIALEVDQDRIHAGSRLQGRVRFLRASKEGPGERTLLLELIGEEKTEIRQRFQEDYGYTYDRQSWISDQNVFLRHSVEQHYTEHDTLVPFSMEIPSGTQPSFMLTTPQLSLANTDPVNFTSPGRCAIQYRLVAHLSELKGLQPTRIHILPRLEEDRTVDTTLTLKPGNIIPLTQSYLCGLIEGSPFRSCVLEASNSSMRLERGQVLQIQVNDRDGKLLALIQEDKGKASPQYNIQVKWTQHIVWRAQGLSTEDRLKTVFTVPVSSGGNVATQPPTDTADLNASIPQHQFSLHIPHDLQPSVSGWLIHVSHSFIVFLSPQEDRAMATTPAIPVNLLHNTP